MHAVTCGVQARPCKPSIACACVCVCGGGGHASWLAGSLHHGVFEGRRVVRELFKVDVHLREAMAHAVDGLRSTCTWGLRPTHTLEGLPPRRHLLDRLEQKAATNLASSAASRPGQSCCNIQPPLMSPRDWPNLLTLQVAHRGHRGSHAQHVRKVVVELCMVDVNTDWVFSPLLQFTGEPLPHKNGCAPCSCVWVVAR